MGHPNIQTPHLDKLAQKGKLFKRGYVAAPICRPSLASIVTGRFPQEHGITGNDRDGKNQRAKLDLPARAAFHKYPSFIKSLTKAGYLTFQSGKWWEGSYQDGGFTHGMTHADPKRGGRHGDAGLTIGRKGMKPIYDFISNAQKEQKPFFVWYAPFLPHTPHNPPAALLKKYTQPGRARDVAKYYAMCEWFDQTCGELSDYLDKNDLSKNTLILYVCDNGWLPTSTNSKDPNQQKWKEYALRTKSSPYENGIRSPIFAVWPGRIEPTKSNQLAHSIDFYPTIAAASGITLPDDLTGVNLLDDEALNQRKRVFGTCHASHNVDLTNPNSTLQYAWCIEGPWKLLVRFHGKDTTKYVALHNWDQFRVRLFNLSEDPTEQQDLAEKHPKIVAKMQQHVQEWLESSSRVKSTPAQP